MKDKFLRRVNLNYLFDNEPTSLNSDNFIVKGSSERIFILFKSMSFSFIQISLWDNGTMSLQNNQEISLIDIAIESKLGQEILEAANEVDFEIRDFRGDNDEQ